MKELKTIRDILQAFLDGHEVEYWGKHSGAWLPATLVLDFNSQNLDREIEFNKYRIKPTKPSIDWSRVSEEYRYLARDEGGQVYLYKHKPKIDYLDCWSSNNGICVSASVFKSLEVGNCDWTESLVERPKE